MSQMQINNNPNVPNMDIQAQGNVQNANAQPRADLPPEMQNARPSNRGILARIGAFLFGAGAAGAGFGLGYVGTLAVSSVVAGIATGGAALIGGVVGLGIFAGIRALVNYIRRAPDPEPRLQNQPQNHLPQAQPAADASNNAVANAVTGNGVLSASLQNAADRAISKMRGIYGEALVPQGAKLDELLFRFKNKLANDIRSLQDNITAEQMESLAEQYLRQDMAYKTLENTFEPLCEQYGANYMDLCNNAVKKHPELLNSLTNATSQAQVQEILNGYAEEFRAMPPLFQQVTNLYDGTKRQMVSTIAEGLGLDADSVATFVDTDKCRREMDKLRDKILQGKLNANEIDAEFGKLAARLAKPYVDSFAAVDADKTLSEATKKAMKIEILKSDAPDPKLFSNGIAAGKTIDASQLKHALDREMSREAVGAILNDLGEKINEALQAQYTPDEWAELVGGKPAELRATQGAAFLAMLETVPDLREALGNRPDLVPISNDMDQIMASANATENQKGGALAIQKSLLRLQEIPLSNSEFATMEKQTRLLNTIRSANIPQELKTSWSEKIMNGAIAEPAMVQALIENVPHLSAETRPLMERFILLQSYAPTDAAPSAQAAHAFAQEMTGWRNFDTAQDPAMAPVANWIREDITGHLVGDQEYDRGISNQMKLDAPRGVYTINGEVLNSADGDEVARALRRSMPSENAAKLVSSIINQRTFGILNGLGMQMHPTTGAPIPNEVLTSMTKMASRDLQKTGKILHFDLATARQADLRYKVTVQNGKAHIEMSELVGLDSGLGTDENGKAQLVGKARYTMRFECDLGEPPSIESVHLEQQLLPIE